MNYHQMREAKVENPLKKFYNEEYYRERCYEFEVKYPFFEITAKILMEKFKPKRVLDAGCVKGYLVYAFRQMGVEAYGVDMSEYALSHSPESIRGYLQNVDVDFEKLPFDSQTFDMATALECLEHLQNPTNLLSEMARVLKPGGVLYVVLNPNKIVSTLVEKILRPNPTLVNLQTKSFWMDTFERHGFTYIGHFPGEVQADTRDALRNIGMEMSVSPTPGRIGRFLLKFGEPGKWLRRKLLILLPTLFPEHALLFALQR